MTTLQKIAQLERELACLKASIRDTNVHGDRMVMLIEPENSVGRAALCPLSAIDLIYVPDNIFYPEGTVWVGTPAIISEHDITYEGYEPSEYGILSKNEKEEMIFLPPKDYPSIFPILCDKSKKRKIASYENGVLKIFKETDAEEEF
jgi:hypothetical protein